MPQSPFGQSRRRHAVGVPSLNFLLLALIFAGSGAALWHGLVAGRFFVFTFVVAGWVVSLCLHEFAHAATAYAGGDRSAVIAGYLDLDPMRYADPLLSIVLPLVYILIGGFGLPGGAVIINDRQLRSRGWMSAVSAAGPAMNLLCLALLAALYQGVLRGGTVDLAFGVGVLALFQATAIILNLLPFPGLDGFGILRPFLSPRAAAQATQIGGAAFLVLFLLLWLTPAGGYLIRLALDCTRALGIDDIAVISGFRMLKLF